MLKGKKEKKNNAARVDKERRKKSPVIYHNKRPLRPPLLCTVLKNEKLFVDRTKIIENFPLLYI